MPAPLNKNNSAVKRIMQEAKELANDPSTDYSATPLEDDIFEWHCTLRGPAGTEFEGGLYHFRILLPAEYPFRPPSLMMLTPNGRFELNTKICISFTNYHEELWQPAWGVRTAIIGLQGFFPLKGQQAVGVGSIEYPSAERKRLAALSRGWVCPHCNESNLKLLPEQPIEASGSAVQKNINVPEPLSLSSEAEKTEPAAEPEPTSKPTAEPDLTSKSTAELEPTSEPTVEPEPTSELLAGSEPRITPEPAVLHNIGTLLPSGVATGQTRPGPFITRAGVETPTTLRATRKPPLVLVDGAICMLFAVAFAIIYRRMV